MPPADHGFAASTVTPLSRAWRSTTLNGRTTLPAF